jgi:putative membrane protein
MTDMWLAIAHHVLVFSLVIMLAAQLTLVRDVNAPTIRRLARIDIGYAIVSLLIIAIGVSRVIYGAKGYLYYASNAWFWAKMASFAMIGLLSIVPTLRFRVWQKGIATNPQYLPDTTEISRVRFMVQGEVCLMFAVVAFAAIMARYRGI